MKRMLSRPASAPRPIRLPQSLHGVFRWAFRWAFRCVFRWAFLWLLLLAVPACRAPHQGYKGERRPENEVAILGIRYDVRGTDIWIERINDQKAEVPSGDDVEILPGRVVIDGRASGFGQPSVGAPFQIDFLARAGERYTLVLDQPTRSERLLISIEEQSTDEAIASLEVWP